MSVPAVSTWESTTGSFKTRESTLGRLGRAAGDGASRAASPASSAPGHGGADLPDSLWNPRLLGATLASPALALGEASRRPRLGTVLL